MNMWLAFLIHSQVAAALASMVLWCWAEIFRIIYIDTIKILGQPLSFYVVTVVSGLDRLFVDAELLAAIHVPCPRFVLET